MNFIHLSDLHLGKRVKEFSMLEEQKYILDQILNYVDERRPDAVLIAGDIYDKSMTTPPEAIMLFDQFLTELAQRRIEVFVIYGNHDSAERLAFGNRLMDISGVHLCPVFDGTVSCTRCNDEFGELFVYMLPFVKPSYIRRFFEDVPLDSYEVAVKTVLDSIELDRSKRNLLVAHQFIAKSEESDSEERMIGGLEEISISVFDAFDYVALGHLHRPQSFRNGTVCYAGSPLKYSVSEIFHTKSVPYVKILEKGRIEIETLPLFPRTDMRELKGELATLLSPEFYNRTNRNDYFHVALTNEEYDPNALAKLREIYPNIMPPIDYPNRHGESSSPLLEIHSIEQFSPIELFAELFERQNNRELSDEQRNYIRTQIESIWEEKVQ